MPPSTNHRPELDGLRALAVLLVIASHLPVPHLTGGWIGVDVFFVLSGYLITSILVREFERTSTIALGRFYLRRVLRLYPALITMFVVCAIWYQHFATWPPNFTVHVPFTSYLRTVGFGAFYLEDFVLGYTGNPHGSLGHTWSLALEEQFYLVWGPLLWLSLKRGWSVAWVSGTLMLASTASLVWGSGSSPGLPLTYYRPDSRANELFLGCLLAVLLPRLQARLATTRGISNFYSFVGLASLIGVQFFSDHMTRTTLFPLEEVWAGISAAIVIVGLTVGAERSLVSRALSTWPAVSIGRISYGMYLWLIPITVVLIPYYFFLWHWDFNWWLYSIISLATIIAVASASYFLIEKRFLRLKRYFEVVPTSPETEGRHLRSSAPDLQTDSRPVQLPAG